MGNVTFPRLPKHSEKGKGSHLHHEDFLLDDCEIVPRLQLDNLRTSKVNEGQSSGGKSYLDRSSLAAREPLCLSKGQI